MIAQFDLDGDGLTVAEEIAIGDDINVFYDADNDGIADAIDSCPNDPETTLMAMVFAKLPIIAPWLPMPASWIQIPITFGDLCDSMPNLAVADSDGDGIEDSVDNCVNWPNAGQANAHNEDLDPLNNDTIGDACQCGDVDGDGYVTSADADVFSDGNGDPISISSTLSLAQLQLCDVSGDGLCTHEDGLLLDDYTDGDQNIPDIRTSCPSLAQVADRALGVLVMGPMNGAAVV